MKKNMGIFDRILRVVLAIIVAILIYMETLTGTAAIVLGIIAGVFLLTSLVGFCGLYSLLGFNTCAVKKS
ncbi:MAG: DUF2892 domain-containing protein [Bacteroidetes bacterium]|nr:MAG: DUF2892 domain-containing protein [Bacteroidota bacterium]